MHDPTLQEVRKRLLDDIPALQEIRRRRPLYVEKLVRTVHDGAEYNQHYAAPAALELDRRMERDHDYFAWDLVKAGLQYRFLSKVIPGMVEGVGGLTVMSALLMEELCSTCAGIANIFGAHALGISPILVAGAIAQWETVLREVAEKEKEGEPVLMAAALTEPSAGTDAEEPQFLAAARPRCWPAKGRCRQRWTGYRSTVATGTCAITGWRSCCATPSTVRCTQGHRVRRCLTLLNPRTCTTKRNNSARHYLCKTQDWGQAPNARYGRNMRDRLGPGRGGT